jgi:hypothetical protein
MISINAFVCDVCRVCGEGNGLIEEQTTSNHPWKGRTIGIAWLMLGRLYSKERGVNGKGTLFVFVSDVLFANRQMSGTEKSQNGRSRGE